ncbi:TolC family outer membrane protein [Rhodanobacter sp. C03]|uniref:TolC family outer membrane protein n=1 Tax=Rhodanobacter sp. C03 TaxID=1945858 RepID=UPI000985C747|nr:TolC family outer membrane protein [Rhodanobacter sp. C03]OOG59829.1 type I secretion protein TolC [Rhodanobacter sp. C03]
MRVKLLPLLLCMVLAPLPGHAEDLMDAYRQAVANDPVLSTADAARLVVAENVPQARSALLPQLSVGLGLEQIRGGSGSITSSNGNIVDTGSSGYTRERDLSGVLSQPIINLAAIASLRAAQATRDSGDQTYQAALQNLYVRVSAAYFNVLVAQDNLDVYRSYEDAYKQEFNQSSTRFKNGLAMASDVSQSQAYYLYIKSQRITAQDTLKDAQRGLEQITGKPTGTLKKLREDLPMQAPVPAEAQAWVDAAMHSNPVILAAHYTVAADEHRVSAARAGHLPTLSATVQYGKFGSWSSAVPGAAAYGPGVTTIGLTLTVPIFSGGLTQSQVRQAIAQRDEDAGTLESQRRQAARDANNYFNLVVDGIDQVDAARTSVEAARKSLASMRAGYEIGTQSLTNVVFAIEQLANVQTEYTYVRHQFILNKLLLKQVAGTVDIHDLEDINRLLQ